MKTKDIAYGGMMIALFLAISLVFRSNTRVVQTYLEIVKTIIIAVLINKTERKIWWVFAIACFLSCMFFVSVPDTLIYNVPSIIGGCVIGFQNSNTHKIRNFFIFFIVNSLMIIYEFIVFGLFMKTNLFLLYKEMAASILSEFIRYSIGGTVLQAAFILFMIIDSAVSSFIIFILSQIVIKKLKWTRKSYSNDD